MYAGRVAKNHPRYKRDVDDNADDRATPQTFVDGLGIPFTLDVAASRHNAKCKRFFDRKRNGLRRSWAGETVWCNPPYSNILPWIDKAWASVLEDGCPKVVLLLPANRTEQEWWQCYIEPIRDGKLGRPVFVRVTTRFLGGRIRFLARNGRRISHQNGRSRNTNPPFGNVLVTFERAS